jgi:flagellar hook-associated protein 2
MAISGIGFLGTDVLAGFLEGRVAPVVAGRRVSEDLRERLGAGLTVEDRRLRREATAALERLSAAAAKLDLADADSALRARAVTSTDPSAVTGTAEPTSTAAARGSGPKVTVTVAQVAVAQANVGRAQSSAQTTSLAAGTYTVQISRAGVGTAVSFTVREGDSNTTVLGSFAAAVNASSRGDVVASVERDAAAGTSRLVLAGRRTGTDAAFTITDLAGSAVAAAGVGGAARAAANAVYTVNGVAATAQTNEVTAGEMHLVLRGASAAPVVLTVGPATTRVEEAAADLVEAYGEARRVFDAHADRYPREAAALRQAVDDLRGALGRVGLEAGRDGGLSLDRGALRAAVADAPGRVRAVLGEAGGLAHALRAGAETALGAPGGLELPRAAALASYRRQGGHGALASLVRASGGLVDALA